VSRYATGAASVVLFLVVAGLLQVGVHAGVISSSIVAAPSDIAAAFGALASDGDLVWPFLITLFQVAVATVIASFAGVAFGHVLARNVTFSRAYVSWLGGAFSAPIVLLYPLFLVLFGRSYLTVIVMASITAFIPVAIKAHEAFAAVPRVLLAVGESFTLSPAAMFRMIELPAALPRLFIGLRLGIIYALVNVIAIEFLIDFGGLGRVVSDLYAAFNIAGMYAAILLILVLSGALLGALDIVQHRLQSRE
jgi:NitT/TauT family transport system permease protein